MARLLVHRGTRRTVRFCTFGGEERNFIGSRAYVRRLSESGDLERIRAYLNLVGQRHQPQPALLDPGLPGSLSP